MKLIPYNKEDVRLGSVIVDGVRKHKGTSFESFNRWSAMKVVGYHEKGYYVKYHTGSIGILYDDIDHIGGYDGDKYTYIDNSHWIILFFKYCIL